MVVGQNGPNGQHVEQIVGVIVVELAILLQWRMEENIVRVKTLCLIIALVECAKVCLNFFLNINFKNF